MASVYGTYYKKGNIANFRSFIDYTITQDEQDYNIDISAGIQCQATGEVGATGFKLVISGYDSETLTNQTYYASGQRKLVKYVYSTGIPKTTASQSFTLKATLSGNMTSSSVATLSLTIPALESYVISYDANGGNSTTVPENSTKWYNINLTLPNIKPTKTYYTFKNWNTSSDGTGSSYNAWGTYSANAAATLYAQWEPNTYTITYNANGGNGSGTQTKTSAQNSVTLSSGTGFSKSNYAIAGWNTQADGNGTHYALGGSYTNNADITLYAEWELTYIPPTVNNVSVFRVANTSTTNPVEDEEGEYIYVAFDCTNNDSSTIYYRIQSYSFESSLPFQDSGQISISKGSTYSFKRVLSNTTYSKDKAYTIKIRVYNNQLSQYAVISTHNIASAIYPIDLITNGSNVHMGIMAPAVNNQSLTVGTDMYFKGSTAYYSLLTQLLPIGRIDMYAGSTAPTGWLLCDGRAISRETYASLFAVIGTTYGAGDESTTFNVPDMRDRFPVGAGTTYDRNDKGGSDTVTLTTDELPAHTHGEEELTGSFCSRKWTSGSMLSRATGIVTIEDSETTGNTAAQYTPSNSLHLVTIDATHEHDSVGLGAAHENRPPYIGINFIIYTGVI